MINDGKVGIVHSACLPRFDNKVVMARSFVLPSGKRQLEEGEDTSHLPVANVVLESNIVDSSLQFGEIAEPLGVKFLRFTTDDEGSFGR